MKKMFVLCMCMLFLSACSSFADNAGIHDTSTVTGSAASGSGSAVASGTAVSGQAVGERDEIEKQKISIVTDETGEKRELKLGNVNTKDRGVYFSDAYWVTDYSQVIDGHYYYLRYEGTKDADYIIYRDKGEKVGGFNLFEYETFYDYTYYDIVGFAKYGESFYILYENGEEELDDDAEAAEDELFDADFYFMNPVKLARVDLEKRKVEDIYDITSAYLSGDGNLVFCNIYKNGFYFDLRSVQDVIKSRAGNSVKFIPEQGNSHTENVPMSSNAAKVKPYLTYIDGKVYYGIAEGKKVTLFSSDLESGEEREIFQYERKQDYETDVIHVAIDEDYIYCQDYLIPRSGGKMIRVFQNAKIEKGKKKELPNKKYSVKNYTYNKKYIYYIDKKDKVHRISKATMKDVIISDLKAVGVDCTEDNVYIRVHAEAWYGKSMWEEFDDDDEGWVSPDFYSNHIYCMDLDGKNVKQIWKGSWDYQ